MARMKLDRAYIYRGKVYTPDADGQAEVPEEAAKALRERMKAEEPGGVEASTITDAVDPAAVGKAERQERRESAPPRGGKQEG
jgi:hypothetical protein